ncbi:hypothetical protein [Mycobacterium sp. Aquia_213]|uniref:hypothetical protein n=1 Tax=Mycobacterium sp. Aquia_213 TaxID=2991728 RepID=UPI00226D9533|nr:hypothetical protein LMQ14_08035 [Mycobacterium sp. Aquia_213]
MQQYTPQARFTATVDEGADQLVWLASSASDAEWTPGEYYVKRRVCKASRLAVDPRLAGELWERTSAKIT